MCMDKKIAYIFGEGGHARVIASLIQSKYSQIKFVSAADENIFFEDIKSHSTHGEFFIGIGSNETRRKIFLKIKKLNLNVGKCIAPTAFIAADAKIGEGVVICPGAVVMTGALVGDNVIVNTLSSVDHDCVVGNHSQITAGVTFGGGTKVGENCFFGIKSATIPNVTISDNVFVMAGALVTKNISSDLVVGGSPAVVIKKNVTHEV